jgi:hypothetical protein
MEEEPILTTSNYCVKAVIGRNQTPKQQKAYMSMKLTPISKDKLLAYRKQIPAGIGQTASPETLEMRKVLTSLVVGEGLELPFGKTRVVEVKKKNKVTGTQEKTGKTRKVDIDYAKLEASVRHINKVNEGGDYLVLYKAEKNYVVEKIKKTEKEEFEEVIEKGEKKEKVRVFNTRKWRTSNKK